MAHTKSGGSTKLGRDSKAKRLGVKYFGGSRVQPGFILVRQRGTAFVAGPGVRRAGDDTLYAVRRGTVAFKRKRKIRFDNSRRDVTVVEVIPSEGQS